MFYLNGVGYKEAYARKMAGEAATFYLNGVGYKDLQQKVYGAED